MSGSTTAKPRARRCSFPSPASYAIRATGPMPSRSAKDRSISPSSPWRSPCPTAFRPRSIGDPGAVTAGTMFRVVGFGVTREGDGKSSGQLREATLAARKPLSAVLLWAEDPDHQGTRRLHGRLGRAGLRGRGRRDRRPDALGDRLRCGTVRRRDSGSLAGALPRLDPRRRSVSLDRVPRQAGCLRTGHRRDRQRTGFGDSSITRAGRAFLGQRFGHLTM